jgi:hypothetical protein
MGMDAVVPAAALVPPAADMPVPPVLGVATLPLPAAEAVAGLPARALGVVFIVFIAGWVLPPGAAVEGAAPAAPCRAEPADAPAVEPLAAIPGGSIAAVPALSALSPQATKPLATSSTALHRRVQLTCVFSHWPRSANLFCHALTIDIPRASCICICIVFTNEHGSSHTANEVRTLGCRNAHSKSNYLLLPLMRFAYGSLHSISMATRDRWTPMLTIIQGLFALVHRGLRKQLVCARRCPFGTRSSSSQVICGTRERLHAHA